MSSPPEYLTKYLNKIAKNEGFVKYALNYEAGSSHGDGLIATMIAVTIKEQNIFDVNTEKEIRLMCKLLPENKARREFFQSVPLFEREVHIYNEILPMLKQFQIERNISTDDGFFDYPKCYMAVADATKDHYVIIMENLKMSGYEMWNKMEAVDFHTSSIFLASLGRFHGLSFALRDQEPELFQKLQNLDGVLSTNIEYPTILGMLTGGIDKGIDNLEHQDEIIILKKIKENLKPLFKSMFAPNVAGRCGILSHGDCWNNNFCFLSDGNKKPNKICFFDWQLSGLTSPGIDLSYYLFTSTTKELRARYEDLLRVYYDSMSALVTNLGSDLTKLFTFEELKKQMKEFGIYGILMTPIILQIIVSESQNISDLNTINKDTDDVRIATLNDSSRIIYSQRVSDAIQDAIKFEWINF